MPENRTKIVALTGPESCGKTTLATQLSGYYKAPVVPEYAREFLSKTQGKYSYEDLEIIAREQLRLLESAKIQNPHLLFTDTELTVIKIWSEIKFNQLSPWIKQQYELQKIDLYLLCQPDIPWEEDPLRESKNNRAEIFNRYKEELDLANRPYAIISGAGDERLNNALAAVDKLLLT